MKTLPLLSPHESTSGTQEGIFNYSDGEATEKQLLAFLKACGDVSCFSEELSSHLTDWPTEYHLSPARHNLLRLFPFKPGDRILELGCGCGAITRYLGESGAEVIAVEGSERRAEIARERCRDLPNVSIRCGNLMDFRADELFDYVTLIGVLEYAPKYIDSPNPVHACLSHATSFLSDSGILVTAIENKLGLKYFNGLAEDHLGIPYFGIYDLYGSNSPVTFGRFELAAQLRAAGLIAQEFFLPFPDYKLPKAILSQRVLQEEEFSTANHLALMASHDPSGRTQPVFHEQLVWQGVTANGLLLDLANSFLVVAGRDGSALAKLDPTFLASAHTSNRLPQYTTETIFRKSSRGQITVEKKSLCSGSNSSKGPHPFLDGELLHHVSTVSDYVSGTLYVIELQKRLARGEGITSVIEWARDWLSLLSTAGAGIRHELPGIWLDAIPQNYIRTNDGSLHRIDDEWELSFPIPIAWVIVRGLSNAFAVSPTSLALDGLSLQEAIRSIAASAGIQIDERDFQFAIELEAELRAKVFGHDKAVMAVELSKSLEQPPQAFINTPTLSEALTTENKLLVKEIQRIKSTVSWQLTKPLRLLANLPRLMREHFLSAQE